MLLCYFGPIKSNSSLEAEFIAILIGCRICKIMKIDFSHMILETDNKLLVDAINSLHCPLYNYFNSWLEMVNFMKHMHAIKHTFRESNAVVDILAKQGKILGQFNLHFSKMMLNSLCRNYIMLDQWSIPYIKLSTNNECTRFSREVLA
jgi:hypothetical protein